MPLLLLFIAIPLIEIALFIQIGGIIGLGWTLAIVFLTAIIGSSLVRQQGSLALRQLQQSFNALSDPTEPLAHGAMILFSGVLLLTPGFFTDAVGFALLIPPVRQWVFTRLRARMSVQSFTMGAQTQEPFTAKPRETGPDVIDGEFTDVTGAKRPTHSSNSEPSGWTKH